MRQADTVLGESKRPFLGPSLWAPLLLLLAACAGIVYEGYEVGQTLRQSARDAARAQGLATANEIAGVLDREQERLRAFVVEKEDEVRKILAFPDNWPAVEAIQESLRRMFRGALAFTVTGPDGVPLFEDFDGLVGEVCQASMRDYATGLASGIQQTEIPPIHPVPGAYHFDLISPWKLDDGQSGLFFISMSPERIVELIAAAERASGNRIYLTSRSQPTLIEVAASGARDTLQGDFRLGVEGLPDEHFSTDLPGTHWRLLVVPDQASLEAGLEEAYITTGLLVAGLLAISGILLFLIRRSERRNSSLFMRSLQSSVSRQRAILQSMVDGMVTIDSHGKIHHVNNAVTKLFGYQAKELIGSNVRVLMPEPDRSGHDGYLSHYINTGESKILGKGREVVARRKDGSVFPALLTLGESLEGEERMFVGILHDMTAYNEAQRKIVAQAVEIQRSHRELDEISQIASNNLQTPLQHIASVSEALGSDRGAALSGNEKAQLKALTSQARDMSDLVKGLADYTRSGHAKVKKLVDIGEVVADVQRDMAERIAAVGAKVTVGQLPQVRCDPKQLHQLVWNLFDNALKFRDPQRSLTIDVARLDQDTAEGDVVVAVKDNGIGIPEDQLERVFEAFHRVNPDAGVPGAGLGLSFCRKIAEGAGGRISVSGALGEGSTFTVVLPRAAT